MPRTDGSDAALQPVYVLHRRVYRETSLLLECLSPTNGRVGLVALGARRRNSPWRGLLEPFQPLLIRWSGRGELGTLRSAEPAGPPLNLPGRALAAGFYLSELVMRMLPRDDPAPDLFVAYGVALRALADGRRAGWVLRLFEKQALAALGYGFDPACTRDGTPLQPDGWYRYGEDVGLTPCSAEGPGAAPGWALLALAEETPGERAGDDPARPLLPVMRAALRPLIGDRPLTSRSLLRRAASQAPQAPVCEGDTTP